MSKLNVAILGSGNIGTDLLFKTLHSPLLTCAYFIGRNLASPGIMRASSMGIRVSDRSVEAILQEPDCCDLIFDATSARDHRYHWSLLEPLGKRVIDLTPAKVGTLCIPAINMRECLACANVNMVSCGGQTSIPLAYVLGQIHPVIDYIEVVSSIASRSAGLATRINLDEYIETTEDGLRHFSGCRHVKAILNLNPAEPCINMQTTISAKIASPRLGELTAAVQAMVNTIQSYVPGYELIVPPLIDMQRVVMMVRVRGRGDYLPAYAGNLDIINCAAIAMAEAYARESMADLTTAERMSDVHATNPH